MNKFAKIITQAAHLVGIYPDDGKCIIYIDKNYRGEEELMEGVVIGSASLCGHKKLEDVTELYRLGMLVEAANALRVPPSTIEKRLNRGEKIVYRSPQERK